MVAMDKDTCGTTTGEGLYFVYRQSVNFVNYKAEPLPEWDNLTRDRQDAWNTLSKFAISIVINALISCMNEITCGDE